MAASKDVEWETCTEDDCIGVRLPTGGKCWAHADDYDLDSALKQFGEHGRLDARGVPVAPALLQRLLAAGPHDDQGRPVVTDARFDQATFQGPAVFRVMTFQRYAVFVGATFQGNAWFDLATFQGEASFQRATFQHTVWFRETTFQRDAWFQEATFQRDAWFHAATFEIGIGVEGATFQRLGFEWATFHRARRLGPMLVRKSVVLDDATFHERVQIEVSAAALCCRRARFLTGVQLRVRWAQVVLDDADLAAPSILAGVPALPGLDEKRLSQAWQRLLPPRVRDGRPRLLSLRRADVAGLTVANADLRTCRFLGAHNLDKLRAEGNVRFGLTRSALATSRQTIAEEHQWRINRDATSPWAVLRRGWYPAHYQPPGWLEVEKVVPAQVAGLYRALRKSREDAKDEPGAADFYYGEMEMRRHARYEQARDDWREGNRRTWAAAQTEHIILWLYWLVSGYGLRAWRALAAFLVLLVVAAGLFAFGGGFASSATVMAASPTPTTRPAPTSPSPTGQTTAVTVDTSFSGALVYSTRTVIGLTRAPQPGLTRFGDVIQILLRVLGPVLLGLAVLSVRGRVKR